MTDKLIPCPFCGASAHRGLFKKQGCSLHGDAVQYVRVYCSNPSCPAKPSILGGDIYCGKEEAIQEAIKIWNTRLTTTNGA